jgi:hypothetical protein
MRFLGGLLALGATAVLAGAAAAAVLPAVPPVPPVPTVPITVPSNTLPVPVPSLSPTPAPSPSSTPSTPLPAPVVSAGQTATTAAPLLQAAGASVPTADGPSSNTSSSGGSGASADGSRSSGRRVDNFRSSRRWIGTTGSKHRRTTTFVFVLSRAGQVVFAVDQVSPACRGIGRFSVAGHAGVNRVRFGGRMHGRQLAAGTYRISARTVSGRVVRRITLVVVSGPAPSHDELSSLRAANVCEGGARDASSTATGATVAGDAPTEPPSQSQVNAAGLGLPHPPNLDSGVLGSTVQRTAKALQPLLVALLAVAILLLGVASLPRAAVSEPRFSYLLVQHRAEITALGAATLVAIALTFLLA